MYLQVAFLEEPKYPDITTIFVINRIVDLFFIIDVVLNFFLAYVNDEGTWITQP